MVEIAVVGYPRSGTVWVARLLGDLLNYPVTDARGNDGTLAAEGFNRKGDGRIIHAHLLHYEGTVVFVRRDPRDVAVSMSEFWGWSLEESVDRMIHGPGPLDLPPWKEYVESWAGAIPVQYENLYHYPFEVLSSLMLQLDVVPVKRIYGAIQRQSFTVKRTEMREHGDDYPFGREAQLKHLRKGTVGEWREHFTPELEILARKEWGC